jgi:hypothetical protein
MYRSAFGCTAPAQLRLPQESLDKVDGILANAATVDEA